jgi:type IV pilus assembly protein PilC
MAPLKKKPQVNSHIHTLKAALVLSRSRAAGRKYVPDMLQQLVLLTATGLSVVQSLDVLATQHTGNEYMTGVLTGMADSVRQGKSLGEACAEHPEMFSLLICTVLARPETPGTMHPLLLQLSEYELREKHVQHKIRWIWLCACGAVLSVAICMFLVVAALIPAILRYCYGSGAWSMQSEGGYVLSHYSFLWLGISVVLAAMVFSAFKVSASGKMLWKYCMYSMPVFGEWNQKILLYEITHMLSMLLACGLSCEDALLVMTHISGDRVWLPKMLKVSPQATLSEKFRTIEFFPDSLLQLITAGENSRNIASVLKKVSDYYAEEIGAALDALAFVAMPVMALAAGLLLGGMLYLFR